MYMLRVQYCMHCAYSIYMLLGVFILSSQKKNTLSIGDAVSVLCLRAMAQVSTTIPTPSARRAKRIGCGWHLAQVVGGKAREVAEPAQEIDKRKPAHIQWTRTLGMLRFGIVLYFVALVFH